MVGEIQKAYNAYAGILKREADEAYDSVERLRSGPIAMPKDREWHSFVYENEQFVDPRIPVRRAQNIHYPGKDNPAAAEVRSGMLERKSKYLKSYTPGWSVVIRCVLYYDTDKFFLQVRPIANTPSRVQIRGSHQRSTAHNVFVSFGAEAWLTFNCEFVFSQVYAQGPPNGRNAPWPCLGLSRRVL